jgi:hypothetical protein
MHGGKVEALVMCQCCGYQAVHASADQKYCSHEKMLLFESSAFVY